MNRGRSKHSALEAIRSWAYPFVLPIATTKPPAPSAIDFSIRTEPELLLMRMEALYVDPGQVRASTPVEFRVLAHVCDYCQCKVRCERDLAYEAAGKIVAWENYCPNASRLKAMAASYTV